MRMKRAFSTVACMNETVDQIIETCRKYAIDGIEIRLDKDNQVMGRSSEEELRQLGKQFQTAGITVTDLGSSICIKKYEEQHTQTLQKVLEEAKLLHTKGIRIFLGNFSAKVNPALPEPDYDSIVKQLKEMCEVAFAFQKELWIETHNEFATGKVLKQLIADVGYENLKVIWDIMHPLEDGEGIEETWEAIGERIAHVHIKDGYDRQDSAWHDYRYTLPGEGALPICSILKLLEGAGYEGYLSFEWESAWREELKGYDNSPDWVLRQYTEYLDTCEHNSMTVPASEWTVTDASEQGRTEGFQVSRYQAEAMIDNRVSKACLKKYGFRTQIKKGQTYHLSVPYQASEIDSRNLVYGMITLYDDQGMMKRRMYLEEEVHGRKGISFKAETEATLLLELGIKRFGKVTFYQPLLSETENQPERKVRVASVFIKVNPDLTYEEHLKRIADGIDRAAQKGADLLGLAENLNTRVRNVPETERFGSLNGRYCSMLKEKAKEHQCYIFFSFRELDEEGIRRNTAVLIGRDGGIVGKYDKSHITITEYEAGIVPGDSYPVFDTDFGRVGLLVCWDTYFPGPARAMAQQGAEMLLVPTAGNPTYRHIARAKEHGVYVVVACFSESTDNGIASAKIVDPCGEILDHTNTDGQAACAEIDLNEEKHIFWLSVGAADAIPDNIYRHEVRDDLNDMM